MASLNDARLSWLIVGAVYSCACSGGAQGESKGALSDGADSASAPVGLTCAASEEEVIDLGTLDPAQPTELSDASALNNHGTVVGTASLQVSSGRSVQHAFRWKASTGMVDLGTLGGANSAAVDVNDADQVAGYANLPNGDTHAVVWDAEGRIRDLGILSGGHYTYGRAINNRGQVIGAADDAEGLPGFIWDAEAGMVAFGRPGNRFVDPLDINDLGLVVGDSNDGPFKWTKEEGHTALDSFGYFAVASAVNNLGDIVGYVISPYESYGVEWTGGAVWRLAGLSYGRESVPWGINDRGVMVGVDSRPTNSDSHDPDVAVQWLNSYCAGPIPLGAIESKAVGVSACGDVVGSRRTEEHGSRGYLWHPHRRSQ